MTTYTFANTPITRSFFSIDDDAPVAIAAQVLEFFFNSCGIESRVWMSDDGWNVAAIYPSDGEKLQKLIHQLEL